MIEIIDEICLGLAQPAEGGGGGSAVIEALSVTPTTESQTINAGSGVDGYSPVNVEAVTSSIDSNITANNIKSGITILGVAGSVEELNAESVTITPTTSAQTITPDSPYNGFDSVEVPAVTSSIDANITAGNIKVGVSILGVSGNVVELDGEQITITPTTSQQVITPTSPHNGITSATVSAVTNAIDANITAGNIKKDVTILGVTGSYEGTTINNQNKTLTANGTYTADSGYTGLGTVTVNVAGGGNGLEIPKEVTNYAGVNILRTASYPSGGYNIPSNCTQIAARALTYAFCEISMSNGSFSAPNVTKVEEYGMDHFNYNSNRSGVKSVNFSNLVQVGNCGLQNAFYGSQCTEIRLPNLTTVNSQGFNQAFAQSRDVSLIDLSSLKNVTDYSAFQGAFSRNDALTTLTCPIEKITTSSACSSMFSGCPLLPNFQSVLDHLQEVSGSQACNQMFSIDGYYQANLDVATSATFTALTTLTGSQALGSMFAHRKALASVSFPALTSQSFGSYTNQFNSMLYNITGCTVHFPSNLQSVIGSWSDVMSGFGGTNTTVLFDLTATE